jgi:glycosyltransferase involved in cell wall biosynthesis
VVGLLASLSGGHAIITFAGSDLLAGAGISLARTCLGIFLSNLAALRASRIICVSHQLREALWWRRRLATVIPDGVDLEEFQPRERALARDHLGWSHEPEVVLLDALRDPINKGLEIARKAVSLLKLVRPRAELHVLNGVQPGEMSWYYNAADVLLCASRQEGSANVVKEALACNLPVVSTAAGDAVERLAGVQPSGIVAREPAAMARGLEEVLVQGKRCNGREKVKHLALGNVAREVLRIYRDPEGPAV